MANGLMSTCNEVTDNLLDEFETHLKVGFLTTPITLAIYGKRVSWGCDIDRVELSGPSVIDVTEWLKDDDFSTMVYDYLYRR